MSSPDPMTDEKVLAASRRLTRRSFAVGALGAAAGFGAYQWIENRPPVGEQAGPLRDAIHLNAALSQAIFHDSALAPTYPLSRAEPMRLNGRIGLKQAIFPDSWRLQLVGAANPQDYKQYVPDVTAWEYRYEQTVQPPEGDHFGSFPIEPLLTGGKEYAERAGKQPRGLEEAGPSLTPVPTGTPGLLLTLDDLLKLPRVELVTEFKCVEGWSQIAHWGGVHMADFIDTFPPAKRPDGSLPRYVYMETPSGDYYVGYDMHVCRHPQTLLATEVDGKPLTQLHGAPLRLHTPAKYGYKQIKRIGLIAYTDQKPDDYWSKLGYDWYAGL